MSATTSARAALPSLIGIAFGGLWAVIGALALVSQRQGPALLGAALVTLALAALIWRRRAALPASALFGRRAYLLAVAMEVAGLYAVAILLPRYGLEGYFIAAVGVVVGLHFIGLKLASGADRFLWIAGLMCAVSLAAMLVPAGGWGAAANLRNALCGFGNALVLWIAAARAR